MSSTLSRIIHYFILPCREASFLIEKRLHTKLSLKEAIQLRAHLSLCKLCHIYDKKARALHQLLQKINRKKSNISTLDVSEYDLFKAHLKEKLHQHL